MLSVKTTQKALFVQEWTGELSEYITAVAWSTDGYLAASSAAGEVMLWNPQTRQSSLILSPSETTEQSIDCLGFSCDGQFLAAGGQDGKVRVWQVQPEPYLIHTLAWGSQWIDRLAWHPESNQLAFSIGRYVQVWDADFRQILATLPFAASSVLDLAWHPQGKGLAIAGDGGVKVWEAKAWNDDPYLLGMPAASTAIAWSPDGEYLAANCLEYSVFVWRWGNFHPWRMSGFGGKARHLAWSEPHSGVAPLLAVSSLEGIFVWKKEASDELGWTSRGLILHEGIVEDLGFSPNSLLLASVSEDGWLLLWQKAKQMIQRLEGATKGFSCLAWDKEGNQLAAGGQNGELFVWSKSRRGQGFG